MPHSHLLRIRWRQGAREACLGLTFHGTLSGLNVEGRWAIRSALHHGQGPARCAQA